MLSAFARGFTVADTGNEFRAAGMSSDEIAQADQALVNSSSFAEAIGSLPASLQDVVTRAAIDAFSKGLAHTMIATAVLALVVTVIVAFVWPPRRPQPEPDQTPPADRK